MWAAYAKDPKVKLTCDGVHMAAVGNRLMARGVLAAMGVSESSFAKIEREAWKTVWVLCRFDLKAEANKADYIAQTKTVASGGGVSGSARLRGRSRSAAASGRSGWSRSGPRSIRSRRISRPRT